MKKLFTLCAAVIASFSLWAADPNYGSYDWGTNDFETVFTNHDGIVLSSDVSAWKGNLAGKQYVALGGGTDMSTGSPTPYFGITADAPIDSIEVFWAPNGSNNTSVAWAGWEEASQLRNQTVVAMGKTDTYVASKSYEAAIWQKINLSGYNFKAVMLARQIKKAIIDGQQQSNLGDNQTVNILGIRVWVRETKEVDHVVKTLTGAAVNGEALSDPQMATLSSTMSLDLANAYVEAPTVTFTVQTDTYYVGEETPSTKSEDIDVVAELAAGMWQAQYTIGEQTYTIRATKPATHTITFMDGETVLGTEVVAHGETSTKHTNFETKPLAEFQGWYTDAELTSEANLSATVGADMVLYGKFVKAYAQSLNIEQYILDNGRNNADQDHIGEAFAAVLSGAGYAYSNLNALDTLNDLEKKENRNYAFLGLKMKTAGASIQFNLQAGKTLAVKFGNLTKPIAVTIDGVAQANHTEGAFLLEAAEADRLIELKTTDKATVVLQQIMIGEPIADVTLPDPSAYLITIAESENGTVTAEWANKKYRTPVGETVTLNFTPAAGYMVMHCYVNETEIHQSAPGEPITFEMPAADVTITTEFSLPTAIDNTDAAVKATKRVIDGVLFIEKNGVLYNAQGAIVK